MELWFLGIAAVLLTLAIVYSQVQESRRLDVLEKLCKQINAELDIVLPTKLDTRFTNVESGRRELLAKYNELTNFNAGIAPAVEKLTKDFEVMSIRQRTLEKKIIEANRTVNLIFGKPIPVQVENIPHTKQKPNGAGKGKGALIREVRI